MNLKSLQQRQKLDDALMLLSFSLICQVYGDKDTDGFYRGEVRGRMGLIPCNMVSEIRADDDETMEELIKQGFLPLSTPVDRIGTAHACSYLHTYKVVIIGIRQKGKKQKIQKYFLKCTFLRLFH